MKLIKAWSGGDEVVGTFLRDARIDANLTVAEVLSRLAERGPEWTLTGSSFARMEKGEQPIHRVLVTKFEELYGLSAGAVLLHAHPNLAGSSVREAIENDPNLDGAFKRVLLSQYEAMSRETARRRA